MTDFSTHLQELIILITFIIVSFLIIPKIYKREKYSNSLKNIVEFIFSSLNVSLIFIGVLFTICLHPTYGKNFIILPYLFVPVLVFLWGMSWVIREIVVNSEINKKYLQDQRVSFEALLKERREKASLKVKNVVKANYSLPTGEVKDINNFKDYAKLNHAPEDMESMDLPSSGNNALL